jgi:transcriptional regulator with XRE-family HTH domain
MQFWQRVKTAIKSQNTTQEWVAHKASISFRTFCGWIAKDRLPDANDAVSIAQSLNTTVEYLVTGTDTQPDRIPDYLMQIVDELRIIPREELGDIALFIHAKANSEKTRQEQSATHSSAG